MLQTGLGGYEWHSSNPLSGSSDSAVLLFAAFVLRLAYAVSLSLDRVV